MVKIGMRSIKSNKLDFKKSCGRMAKGFPKRLAPLSSKTTFPNLTQVNFGVLEPFIRKMINYLILIKNKYKFSRIPSAIIQAEFYARCREEKIICYLEFKEKNARFDALIFDDLLNKKFIIEFKSYRDASKKPITNTKQINKYKKFDLPIILITRIEQIDEIINYLKKNIK